MNNQSEMMIKKKYYPFIDIMKFVCAILVTTIHIDPVSSYSSAVASNVYFAIKQYLARIAVPFFFAAAGFFLFQKIDADNYNPEIAKRYVFKNLRLYATWVILLFTGGIGHLWYMGALTVAIVFLNLLLTHNVPLKKIVLLSAVLYIAGLLGDSYYEMLNPLRNYWLVDYCVKAYEVLFVSTRNGIFMGVPFVVIGAVLSKNDIKISNTAALLGFVLSMLVMYFEISVLKSLHLPKDYNMNISLIPSTFFLLCFATNMRINPKYCFDELRVTGLVLYFLHPLAYKMVSWAFEFLSVFCNIHIDNSLLYFSFTIAISIIVGMSIAKLSKFDRFQFLKYLYS